MRKALIAIAVLMMTCQPAFAGQQTAKKKGEKPAASPGWVIVEEDFFYPLRMEAAEILHNARVHYRKGEEKAAANKITQAVSWLKFAAGHGYPETQEDLKTAADELTALATDLRDGNTVAAVQMDASLARAAHSLAMWHYFKANESLARDELGFAAKDLQAAATYLQSAARSAHSEYGDDVVALFEDIDQDGKTVDEGVTVAPDRLQAHLTAVKAQLDRLARVLKRESTPTT